MYNGIYIGSVFEWLNSQQAVHPLTPFSSLLMRQGVCPCHVTVRGHSRSPVSHRSGFDLQLTRCGDLRQYLLQISMFLYSVVYNGNVSLVNKSDLSFYLSSARSSKTTCIPHRNTCTALQWKIAIWRWQTRQMHKPESAQNDYQLHNAGETYGINGETFRGQSVKLTS